MPAEKRKNLKQSRGKKDTKKKKKKVNIRKVKEMLLQFELIGVKRYP